MSSTREEQIKELNLLLNDLHLQFRKEKSKSMDTFLHERINTYASEEMLGKLIGDVQEELHRLKK